MSEVRGLSEMNVSHLRNYALMGTRIHALYLTARNMAEAQTEGIDFLDWVVREREESES